MTFTGTLEHAAMRRALELAATPGVPPVPTPRRLRDHRRRRHRGRGGLPPRGGHAARRGRRAAEAGDRRPRSHRRRHPRALQPRGRTGPCAQALVDAGVRRVVFAQADTNPVAAGGAATLRAAGIEVAGGLLADEARALNRAWTFAVEHGRPFVTWKFATTLDGRSAAADGTSRWVSSPAARLDTHRLRAACDAILVGTGTVEVDDPQLTVRDEVGDPLPRPAAARGDGRARPPAGPPGPRRRGRDRAPAHPRPAARPSATLFAARRPARLPRGRADPGRGVPRGRARRRGGGVRRPDAARLRPLAPSATSASAPSPTPLHLDLTRRDRADPATTATTTTSALTLAPHPREGPPDVHRHRRGARHGRRGRGPGRRDPADRRGATPSLDDTTSATRSPSTAAA